MKNYKDFEKKFIGGSDIAALTVTYMSDSGATAQLIKFGEDGSYRAYICEGDVDIGSHYEKVCSGRTWLKIYDDTGLAYQERRDGMRFDIYQAGSFGCIIHWCEVK